MEDLLKLAQQYGVGALLACALVYALIQKFFPWAAGVIDRLIATLNDGFEKMERGFKESDDQWRAAIRDMHAENTRVNEKDQALREQMGGSFNAALNKLDK